MSISNLPIKHWFKLLLLASSALVIASCDQNSPSDTNKTEEESTQVVKSTPVQVYFDDKDVIKLFPDTDSEEFILASTSLAFYPENISLKDHKLHLEYVVQNLNTSLKLLQLQFNAIVSLYNGDFKDDYKTIQLSLPITYGYSNYLTLGNLVGQDTSSTKRDSNKTIRVVSSTDSSSKNTNNNSSKENSKDNKNKNSAIDTQNTKSLVVEDSPLAKLEDIVPSYVPPGAYFRVTVDYDLSNFLTNRDLAQELKDYPIDSYIFTGIRTLPVSALFSEIGQITFVPEPVEEISDDKADDKTSDDNLDNKANEDGKEDDNKTSSEKADKSEKDAEKGSGK